MEESDPLSLHVKKTRGKSNEKREHDDKHQYSTVQVKLNTIVRPTYRPVICSLFDSISDRISRIAFEAYLLANYHVIRFINEGKIIPTFNQSFFYSCCANVTSSTRKAGDTDLQQSATEYRSLRPEGWFVPDGTNLSHAMASLAREMITMTENHVVLNLLPRLVRYVQLRFQLKNKAEATSFIRGAFIDTTLTDDQKTFKEWILINPCFESNVKRNIGHFLVKLADILRYYESLEPGTKGVRSFTLLPTKSGYVGSFFIIDSTTLPDLLKLLDRSDQERIIDSMLRVFSDGSDERAFLLVRKKARIIFNPDFQKKQNIANILWNTLFDVKKFETRHRKFARLLSTNGYAVTVYQQIPKEESVSEYDSMTGVNEKDFDRFIGLDPGQTYVCTTYWGEKKQGTSKSVYGQVSTTELRHNSKMNERKTWDIKQRKTHQEYRERLEQLPSLKTASLIIFNDRVRSTLSHAGYLFRFCRRSIFRAWRFKTSVYGKKALSNAVKKVVGVKPKEYSRIIVGFGDWSQQDGFLCGKEKAPVKKMRRMMRKQGIRVISIDEHRTSKCCSCCQTGEVKNMYYGEGETKKRCHQVVRCGNSECGVVWQRDVNAARNIRSILLARVRGEQRPTQLKRQRRQGRTHL